jgi:hypothetical protein
MKELAHSVFSKMSTEHMDILIEYIEVVNIMQNGNVPTAAVEWYNGLCDAFDNGEINTWQSLKSWTEMVKRAIEGYCETE